MRVLHVISSIDSRGGGVPVAVQGMARGMMRAGMQVSILATYGASEDLSCASELSDCGVRVKLVGPASGPLARHADIQSAIASELPQNDIVHIHALWEEMQYQAARLASEANIPYVFSPHGMLDPWSLDQSRFKKKLYMALRLRRRLRGAAAIHFTSDMERDVVKPLGLKPEALVEPLGVDFAEFDPLPPRGMFREAHRAQLGDRRFIVYLGRIFPKKGLEVLIPAFAQAIGESAAGDAMLVLIGPDSAGYQASVEEEIRRHDLRERVLFTGMLRGRDRIAALAEADLFVLPSFHENFGMSVIEALAAGTPVLISNQVYIHRAISAAGVGAVVEPAVGAVADELKHWLADDAKRNAATERAIPFARREYDWLRIAERWQGHYQRLCDRHLRSPDANDSLFRGRHR